MCGHWVFTPIIGALGTFSDKYATEQRRDIPGWGKVKRGQNWAGGGWEWFRPRRWVEMAKEAFASFHPPSWA